MKNIDEYSLSAQIWALRHYGEVGPRAFRVLLARFGCPAEILMAEKEQLLAIEGLGDKKSGKITEAAEHLDESEDFIRSLEARKMAHCSMFDDFYPALLEELNDPPPIIFHMGKLPRRDEPTVAIVGSHKATGAGIGYALDLASRLAEKKISIISGLAEGIDASAHIGALKAGGRTHAVIGSGLEEIYPVENKALAEEIIKHGSVISEYSPESKIIPGRLKARNRLVAGLSQSVVIGEVMADSNGTLDTATFCHELGKLMFIMLDGCERPERDNSSVKKIIALGAIPFHLDSGVDLIVKSMV
nr:DNA-protecting protein DprA [candidate division Zixibacteria bacterium]